LTDTADREVAYDLDAELAAHEGADHHGTSTGISNEKLGMWVFLGSECLLFGGLISTFLLYKRNNVLGGPLPHDLYDIEFTSISSFVLLMSSLTMVLSLAAIQRGDHRRMRIWVLTTALLGATFVAGQVYEFTVFIREGLTISTNLFGSSFYVLTGFHGAHVTLGLLMLLSLYVLSLKGRLPTERAETVELVGLYWHFVDIVWIVIFTLIYLIP
jgi:heme/copper-type cytochrome/quinol oxidase subunit 3